MTHRKIVLSSSDLNFSVLSHIICVFVMEYDSSPNTVIIFLSPKNPTHLSGFPVMYLLYSFFAIVQRTLTFKLPPTLVKGSCVEIVIWYRLWYIRTAEGCSVNWVQICRLSSNNYSCPADSLGAHAKNIQYNEWLFWVINLWIVRVEIVIN